MSVGKADRQAVNREGSPGLQLLLFYFRVLSFFQVNVKKPLKDESHFEVVESGRYIILLLRQGLSVVWDHHLSVSVVLKHTHQVSGLSYSILPVSHVAYIVTCCPSPLYWKTVFSGPVFLLPTQGELSSHGGWLHTGRTEASLTMS